MDLLQEPLPGVLVCRSNFQSDQRGSFHKFFHSSVFERTGHSFHISESFITKSSKNVLRGMHYQSPPYDNYKVVYCCRGAVLDVVVDFNKSSPTFNKPFSIELNESDDLVVIIPPQYAHGFLAIETDSWLIYNSSKIFSPSHDKGFLWSSIDFHWPCDSPLLSKRDTLHPMIN